MIISNPLQPSFYVLVLPLWSHDLEHFCRDGQKLATVAGLATAGSDAEFEGHKLTVARNTNFAATRQLLLESLEATLGKRFEDMEAGVMHACCITDFTTWPVKDEGGGIISILFINK